MSEKAPAVHWPHDLVGLYQDQHDPLVRAAYLVLGNQHEAEEVVHDAVLRLRERWSSVENPGGYLRTAVCNGAIDVVRHRRIAERAAVDAPPEAASAELVDVRDALLRLPIRHRTAVVLRYLVDLDDHEIADVLGCRQSTVRSLIARGLTRLRREVSS